MSDAPFETRRLIRDLPELLAGRDPVLLSGSAHEALRNDPVAQGMIVAAMEIGSALEGGTAAVRWRGRQIPRSIRRPVERAHRFFRRRISEVGLGIGFTRYIEQREDNWIFFENADAARPVRGDEAKLLRKAHASLSNRALDEEERRTLAAIDTNDPKRIFPLCQALDPGSSIARYYTLLVDPVRSLDPDAWLDLAGSARDTETIGWALVHAANAYDSADETLEALETVKEAGRYLPGSVTASFDRLVFSVQSLSTWEALAAASCLRDFPAIPQQLVEQVSSMALWHTLARESPDLASGVLRALPPTLSSAIREVTK